MINFLREFSERYPDVISIADVALDPYTSHGHDGILANDIVLNDETNELLGKQAVLLADAGASIVAPSDMMDGRIGVIRSALDANKNKDTIILSYAAKFASSFYGPFRDAVGSKTNLLFNNLQSIIKSSSRSFLRVCFLATELEACFKISP